MSEPRLLFDDSRRLLGANRYFGRPAVVLTALGPHAGDPVALDRWRGQVQRSAHDLGWGDVPAFVHHHGQGTFLAFAAPEEELFTATEVNEWAWEQAGAAEGFDRLHARTDFANRARRERSRPLQALKAAAAAHRLPCFDDDDSVSIGAGRGGVTFARAALPLPMDVPWQRLHDIPIALITGSNGKTTTTRLVAAMAQAAGRSAGLCGTDGVFIGGERRAAGDYSGPAGARAVLRDRDVDIAVLETARGGLLRRGLAVKQASVAAITNVSADHFGEYGVNSVDDIAEAKLIVAHALGPGRPLVLNAGDAVLMAAAARLPHAAAVPKALFSLDHEQAALQALSRDGGSTCAVFGGRLLLHEEGVAHDLGGVADMPLTAGGAAAYNTENLCAAVLVARSLGLPIEAIKRTLMHFGERPQDNPGRLERRVYRGATVLIDYAHNPDGLAKLLAVARALKPRRLLLLLGQAGNRSDEAIEDLARTAAAARPDLVVTKEMSAQYLRGRAPGEVPALLARTLAAQGIGAVQFGGAEDSAARLLLAGAEPGDVVVLAVHDSQVREQLGADIDGAALGRRR